MDVRISGSTCVVTREPGDPGFSNGGWAGGNAGESRLLYHVKKILNARGYNLVKKRMWKDGHLMDDQQQYLRPRLGRKNPPWPHVYLLNRFYMVRGAEEDFSRLGAVELDVVYDVLGLQPDCEEMVKKLEDEYVTRKEERVV